MKTLLLIIIGLLMLPLVLPVLILAGLAFLAGVGALGLLIFVFEICEPKSKPE